MSEPIEVAILCEDEEYLPRYASTWAAGADVKAHILQAVEILPGEKAAIPTGVRCSIPMGYEIQVRPRSGLALKHGITVLNSPGTIDADYRGEIIVILINHGKTPFTVERGMRIAQIVLAPVITASFVVYQELSTTQRGEGGFGHTGTH